jgi:hypothetical protein
MRARTADAAVSTAISAAAGVATHAIASNQWQDALEDKCVVNALIGKSLI